MKEAFLRQYNFSGGQNSVNAAFLLKDDESELLKNVVPFQKGSLRKSFGFTKYFSGQFPENVLSIMPLYSSGLSTKVLVHSGDKIYSNDNTTVIKTGLTVGKKIRHCQFKDSGVDKVYFCNGSDGIMKTDGSTVSTVTAAVNADFILTHAGRLVCNDTTDPLRLRFSEYGNDTNLTSNYINVDGHEGDKIVGALSFGSYILVILSDSVVILSGKYENNFAQSQVSTDDGCVATDSIVRRGGNVLWVGKTGIMRFSGRSAQNISDDKIKDVFIGISADKLAESVASFHERFYVVTITDDYGNKKTIFYETNFRSFSISEGYDVISASNKDGPYDSGAMLFSNSNKYVYQLGDSPSFDSSTIPFEITHRELDMGYPERTKVFKEFWLDADGDGQINFNVSSDFGEYTKTINLLDYNLDTNTLIWDSGNWDDNYWSSETKRRIIEIKLPAIRAKRISVKITGNDNKDVFIYGYSTKFEVEDLK